MAKGLAQYAAICQDNGLVPIVEPEVLIDGTHSIQTCAKISEHVFGRVFRALQKAGVLLEGMVLKPNMITRGKGCLDKTSAQEVAEFTLKTLSRTVLPAVPGIFFLSGGQSEEEATLNVNAMNASKDKRHPWHVSFSFGRALQYSCLMAW